MDSITVWIVTIFLIWLGWVISFFVYANYKGWVEFGLFQSLSESQIRKLLKASLTLAASFSLILIAVFVWLETDLISENLSDAKVTFTFPYYEKKLESRRDAIVRELDYFKGKSLEASKNEKKDIDQRISDIESDYSRYIAWIRSEIHILGSLRKLVPGALLNGARESLANDSSVEADYYLEEIEGHLEKNPDAVSRIMFMRGSLAQWNPDYRKAYVHFVRAAKMARENADYYKYAGFISSLIGEDAEALGYYELALIYDTAKYGADHSKMILNHIALGAVQNRLGNLQEALESYEKALAGSLKYKNDTKHDMADIYYRLGNVSEKMDSNREAISYIEKGLLIDLAAYGQGGSARIFSTWEELGKLWFKVKDFRKAIYYYEKALAGYLMLYGESDVRVAYCRHELGRLWGGQRDYLKAKTYYEQALSGFLNVYGEKDSSVSIARQNLEQIKKLHRKKNK